MIVFTIKALFVRNWMVSSMGKSTLHFISVSTHKMHRDDIEKRTSSKRYSPKSLQIGEIHHRCVQKGHIAEVKRFQLCQICILNPINAPSLAIACRLQCTKLRNPHAKSARDWKALNANKRQFVRLRSSCADPPKEWSPHRIDVSLGRSKEGNERERKRRVLSKCKSPFWKHPLFISSRINEGKSCYGTKEQGKILDKWR